MIVLRRVIGDELRRRRQDQGRTLREVSSAARVSLGYLSEVERGQKEASSELLASICTALDVPAGDRAALGERRGRRARGRRPRDRPPDRRRRRRRRGLTRLPVPERSPRSRAGNAMGRTRAAALDGARRVIAEHGLRKATMGDVAVRGGLAKATLYNHFRTKDELVVGARRRRGRRARSRLPRPRRATTSPWRSPGPPTPSPPTPCWPGCAPSSRPRCSARPPRAAVRAGTSCAPRWRSCSTPRERAPGARARRPRVPLAGLRGARAGHAGLPCRRRPASSRRASRSRSARRPSPHPVADRAAAPVDRPRPRDRNDTVPFRNPPRQARERPAVPGECALDCTGSSPGHIHPDSAAVRAGLAGGAVRRDPVAGRRALHRG